MSDQKACKCGWTGSVDFLEMVLVDEQKHEYEARCPKCSHEITDNPTPTPMSEDTNTTQTAEEFLNSVTIFGKLDCSQSTFIAGYFISRDNSEKHARLYHSEQLAQAKLPSNDDMKVAYGNWFFKEPEWKDNSAHAFAACYNWMRSKVLPYITRLEQENAQLKEAIKNEP